jgi:2-polyprenyl-3-methyl-5-hydroxy-6-metoxy-1,4-benzoquinol methylase
MEVRTRSIVTLLLVCVVSVLAVRMQASQGQTSWDGVYAKIKSGDLAPDEFLARMVKERPPGRALDIGIGEGRNAFLLASLGWEVTGFDSSAAGIKLAQEEAQKRGLRVTTVVADVDQFDYGRQQWDLVAGMYMHEMITRNAAKIVESLKPGGLLVIEGLQFDSTKRGVAGAAYGYRPNELLTAFAQLRVVFYEEAHASPYWLKNAPPGPIMRFAAIREQINR